MDWPEIIKILEENREKPPVNEEETRYRVIDLILDALDYSRKEVSPNRYDGAGGIPDYTILPEEEKEFYLEAKAWNVTLCDDHARQTTNYAYQKGHRWAVLTNGREWKIYDSSIQGKPAERVVLSYVFTENISPDEPPILFKAINREGMTSGKIEDFVLLFRLCKLLKTEFSNPQSDIISGMQKAIKKRDGFGGVTKEMIARCLIDDVKIKSLRPIQSQKTEIAYTIEASLYSKTLKELETDTPTGNKPVWVHFPDGNKSDLRSWKDLSVAILDWLGKNHGLPDMPYTSGRGKTYFMNYNPEHQNGPMRSPEKFEYKGKTVYIECNLSAINMVHALLKVCEHVGFDASKFTIELKK